MKNHIEKILFFLLILGSTVWQTDAQVTNKTKEEKAKIARQVKAITQFLKETNQELAQKFDKKGPCREGAIYHIKNAKYNYSAKFIEGMLYELKQQYFPKDEALKQGKKNSYISLADFALSILSDLSKTKYAKDKNKVIAEFTKRFTGKSKTEIPEKDYKAIVKYVKSTLYSEINDPFFFERYYKKSDGCLQDLHCTLELKNVNYPEFEWEFHVYTLRKCYCRTERSEKDLKFFWSGCKGTLKAIFTSNDFKLLGLSNKKYTSQLFCCMKSKKTTDPKIEPQPKKENSSLPGSHSTDGESINYNRNPVSIVGGGIGVGLQDDFKEIGLGVFGEYLRQINLTKNEKLQWFIGGDLEFGLLSSDFNERTGIKAGPKIQLHKTLPQVGLLQWVNGLKIQYMSSKNERNGFRSTVNGVNTGLFTGLNFPMNNKVNVGVELPVLNFVTSTTKPDVGQEYSNTDILLFLNQNSLARILLRFPLGR